MNHNKHSISLRARLPGALVAAALFVGMVGAQAQTYKPYVGIGVGSSDYDTGIKIYGGAAVTSQFGWEAQYLDFGHDRGPGFDARAWALGLSVMGYLPLQRDLSAFGKIGVHYVRGEVESFGSRFSDSSVELGVGIGAQWQFTPQHAARVEFESIGGSGSDVVSVGVQMKF